MRACVVVAVVAIIPSVGRTLAPALEAFRPIVVAAIILHSYVLLSVLLSTFEAIRAATYTVDACVSVCARVVCSYSGTSRSARVISLGACGSRGGALSTCRCASSLRTAFWFPAEVDMNIFTHGVRVRPHSYDSLFSACFCTLIGSAALHG